MHTKEWYAEGERSATLNFKFKQEFFVLICSSPIQVQVMSR